VISAVATARNEPVNGFGTAIGQAAGASVMSVLDVVGTARAVARPGARYGSLRICVL
jgi:hypothetical protein